MWEHPRLNREEWGCTCGHECADEIEKIAYWYWPDTEKHALTTLVSFHCSACGQYLQFDVRWTRPQIESVKLIYPKTTEVGLRSPTCQGEGEYEPV